MHDDAKKFLNLVNRMPQACSLRGGDAAVFLKNGPDCGSPSRERDFLQRGSETEGARQSYPGRIRLAQFARRAQVPLCVILIKG
jgi:hypothetical protein